MTEMAFPRRFETVAIGSAVLALLAASFASAGAPTVEWIRLLGTTAQDHSSDIALDDSSNIYITGYTDGNLAGPNSGSGDIYVTKFDSAGSHQWTKQIGTAEFEQCEGIALDGIGNIFIAGATFGSLAGSSFGGLDAVAAKFNPAGNLIWTRQLGSNADDQALAAATDSLGNVYISGGTYGSIGSPNFGAEDSFVAKYGPTGNLLWARQQGTNTDDRSHSLSVDAAGNIFVGGTTFGNLNGISAGSIDGFLSRYDASGNLIWSKQFGTVSHENVLGVSADGLGNVYVTGQTFGAMSGPNAGSSDAFITKYDLLGNHQWTRQLGTSDFDVAYSVFADSSGDVVITGSTAGGLDGTNAGGNDVFVSKLDALGNWIWTKQIGSAGYEQGWDVATNGIGTVYVTGVTTGDFGDLNSGLGDAFILKINQVPEPVVSAMLATLLLAIPLRRNRAFVNSYFAS